MKTNHSTSTQDTHYISILEPKLIEISKEVITIYNSNFDYTLKEDNSPLTKADIYIHRELTAFIMQQFPDYAILSEENSTTKSEFEDEYKNNEYIFVIDPLDGTKDFITKTGEFSIMIGLLDKTRQPIFGVVYSPVIDELVWAQKGKGAFLKRKGKITKLQVSSISNIKNSTLIRSRNHFLELDKKISKELEITHFKKCGSVGVKFCEIAKGNAELCYYTNSKMGIWDDCAPHIILKESGGEVFTCKGEIPQYNTSHKKMKDGFIGTNSRLSKEQILKAIEKLKQ